MSAIAGIYHFNGEPISPEQSAGLMKVLEQFPANDIQTWQNKNIFLGCHAQWITPESVGEKLPYYDHNRKLAITSDAVIDNREELFERLQIQKLKQKSMSDSELILLSYNKWEEECTKYLVGDFAFIIWDERKQKLYGARDFSGSRTLYYYIDRDRVVFCTSIKPLFSLPFITKELNENWLAEYLSIPNIIDTVTASSTVYKQIEQIPPSHYIKIEKEKTTISRYCYVTEVEQLKLKTDDDYEDGFKDIFNKSVKSRIRTYRNVGSHLSGGLDSSSIVSIAAKELQKENKQLYTFSSIPIEGFKDWSRKHLIADERPFIKSTVQHVGNIIDNYYDFKFKSPLSELDEWLDIMEMPYKFYENSFWVKGIYEEAQKLNIGLLLNGGRGNLSISWGPALDYYSMLLKKFKWFQLIKEVSLYSNNMDVSKSRVYKVIGKRAFPGIRHFMSPEESESFPSLINPEFAKKTNVLDKLLENGYKGTESPRPNINEIRKKHFDQLNIWNTSGTSGTKLSLRYSLTPRDPTNDIRLIQYCLSLPLNQFVKNGYDRALIRRATKDLLPEKVRLNQSVRGLQGADVVFRMAPVWKELLEEINQLCNDPIVIEFLNINVIKNAIRKIGDKPKLEHAFNPDFRILIRSLIVYRFLKRGLKGGDINEKGMEYTGIRSIKY